MKFHYEIKSKIILLIIYIMVKVNAQEWLEEKFSKRNEKERVESVIIFESVGDLIEGPLEIKDFPNLEQIIVTKQLVKSLQVSGTPKLKKITCAYNNDLEKLKLDCPSLMFLQVNNNFALRYVELSSVPNLVKIWWEKTGSHKSVLDKFDLLEKQTQVKGEMVIDEILKIEVQKLQN